jgi:prolipoprotein diacylglyceryltransferase
MAIYKYYRNNPPDGFMFSIFLVVLFGLRFLAEFSKMSQAAFNAPTLDMGQWLSIPLILAGLWILLIKVNWNHKNMENKGKHKRPINARN